MLCCVAPGPQACLLWVAIAAVVVGTPRACRFFILWWRSLVTPLWSVFCCLVSSALLRVAALESWPTPSDAVIVPFVAISFE